MRHLGPLQGVLEALVRRALRDPNAVADVLQGASNGPARLFIGLPLTDAIFERLSERQRVNAAGAYRAATFNDMLLAASVGYFELVRSQVQVAIASAAVTNAQELARVVAARLRRDQVQAALRQMHAAAEALPLNFKGILGGQLRAIEGLQAVDALTTAQTQYLESIIDYNRAQFALLRALGKPPDPQTVPQMENPAESK